MINYVVKMMNSALKMVILALNMMNSVFKMMHFVKKSTRWATPEATLPSENPSSFKYKIQHL